MARKETPLPTTVDVELNDAALSHDMKIIDEMTVIEAGYSADRDLVNRMLGQYEALDSVSKLVTVTSLSKLAYIKENKLYRAIKGRKTGDGHQFSGTWEEFCSLIGKSREQVDEDIRNITAFGEIALETMQNAGMGIRELRQYRKLPADEKTALIEAAKDGNKDTLLDLAETLIAKHSKEKTDLLAENNELKLNYEAQGKVLEDKSIANDKLATALNARDSRVTQMSPDEIAKELRSQAVIDGFAAEHAIQYQLGATFKALIEHSLDNGGDHKQFMLGLVTQIELELIKVRQEFNLQGEISTDDTPDWMKPGAMDAADKLSAEWADKLNSPEWADHPAAKAASKNKESVN